MKRSEINKVLEDTKALVHKHQITLPPFAYWFPEYWGCKGIECDEIHDCMLGWDITAFGSGEFDKTGLPSLRCATATIRTRSTGTRPTAKNCQSPPKSRSRQCTSIGLRSQDIINRGGDNLMIKLYNSTEDE